MIEIVFLAIGQNLIFNSGAQPDVDSILSD